ncbi:MAG: V-type ATP synthase subunit F [Clostridia bacterium]|nr:V-type ATP synthase subunit F [Clostridia bacterium]
MNKRIAIMGDYDSICGFSALGMDLFVTDDKENAEDTLNNIIEKSYSVIFITEDLAEQLSFILDKYRTQPLPAIIPIPNVTGKTGFGLRYVKKAVEQAVGSDIIFNEE